MVVGVSDILLRHVSEDLRLFQAFCDAGDGGRETACGGAKSSTLPTPENTFGAVSEYCSACVSRVGLSTK